VQGLTQEALAVQCNVLKWDINSGTLAKIESKVRRINDEGAATIEDHLY
jgi:transcriptional regulator with XRE-family HTH domain